MSLWSAIKERSKQINIVEKLIYVIITAFVILHLTDAVTPEKDINRLASYFSFSPLKEDMLSWFYTLFTYNFIHLGFIHLIFNLIVLFYMGNLFLDYFSEKRLLLYFFLGGIFGALFFAMGYYFIEMFSKINSPLAGASAGISALIIGLAAYIPNYQIKIRFIGFVKLWALAAIWVFLSIILIRSGNGENAGGQLAHVGGAFLGFILTKWFFKKGSENNSGTKVKQTHLKTVYNKRKNDKGPGLSNYQKGRLQQKKIDALLDKIGKSGYDALTQAEKDFLNSVGKN